MVRPGINPERPLREELRADDQRERVLIADHDGLARRMMQTALREAGGVVVNWCAHCREALELVRYYRPTVLLIDIALPPTGGVELTRQVLPIVPNVRIVTMAAVDDDDQAALAALRAGAAGHINKDIDPDQLARLVALAADGEAIVPRRLIAPLLAMVRETPDAGWRPLQSVLTTREWQIIELIAEGASTARIAERLVLSPTTVYCHVNRVLRKLGVHSRRDAVAAATRLRQEEVSGKESSVGLDR